MATTNLSVPNWMQKLVAQAVGLEGNITVRMEDDTRIVFQTHIPDRKEYSVNKLTGKVTVGGGCYDS